jgi:large conductance mechanosensitive channel
MDLDNKTLPEPLQKAYSLFEEFKNFALKGSVIDLAVGVIIGTSFAKIVDSLVKNIIMPTIGLLTPGEQGYVGWKLTIGQKEVPYGLFLGDVVNFVLVAFVLFLFIVKFLGWVNRLRHAESTSTPAPPLTTQEQLLSEIRDLLKQQLESKPAAVPK